MAMVDTSILIDLLRGYPASIAWFTTQPLLSVSRPVVMELIEGLSNKVELGRTLKFVGRFQIVSVSDHDFIWATEQLSQLYLSHHVDSFDALIAATAHRLQLPLYTRNLKHFTPMLGQYAIQPYL